MPLYEYYCEDCGYKFEALQRINDEALIHCPACDEPSLKKLVSATSFRLKGDGWYETDFKNGGAKKNIAENKASSEAV